jgi:LmbE family N-acetylglucosaminyl deacetylase
VRLPGAVKPGGNREPVTHEMGHASNSKVKRILFIGAHPDDETFLFGGTLAKYAEEGAQVTVVCATRGERGKTGDVCRAEELPQVREQELRRACAALGIQDVRFLSYIDRELTKAPVEQIRRELVEVIRGTRPQLVLTFDPNGLNQHTDHVAISRFVCDAVWAAADPRWFPDWPAHRVQRVLWPTPILPYKLVDTANLPHQPGVDFVMDVHPWLQKKKEALCAHRTQLPGLRKLFFERENSEACLSIEALRIGFGPRPGVVPGRDLFEGIEEH